MACKVGIRSYGKETGTIRGAGLALLAQDVEVEAVAAVASGQRVSVTPSLSMDS